MSKSSKASKKTSPKTQSAKKAPAKKAPAKAPAKAVKEAPKNPASTAPTAPETASKPRVEPIPQVKESTIESPSKTVWCIADAMHQNDPEVRRVDVVRVCVEKGIALNTAKTQYQRWFTAQKAGK